jgi:hypothetical protein
MHCPALGEYPTIGQDDLVLKLSSTGVTFLHERRYKSRYIGSKTSAVGICGELWPNKADYLKMQALKVPSHLISYSIEGLHYLDKEKYKDATTSKRGHKKKAVLSDCLNVVNTTSDNIGSLSQPQSTEETPICENNLKDFATFVAKSQKKREYVVHKQNVRQRLLSYTNTQKGQKELYFWTVTFPDGTPDDICYQAFNTWLTTLRVRRKDKFGKLMPPVLREYLWIAERQLGERLTTDKKPTYTIHFHIAIPHFMPVTRCNAAMRTILKNLAKKGSMPGAVCNAKTKELYYLPSIARYNGVHISRDRKGNIINFAVKRNSKTLANYLTKYITKNNAGIADEFGNVPVPAFTHLAWHNSRGFSCLFTSVCMSIKEFDRVELRFFLNRCRQFRMEFATFIPWLYGPPPLLMEHLFQLNSYLQTILHDGR